MDVKKSKKELKIFVGKLMDLNDKLNYLDLTSDHFSVRDCDKGHIYLTFDKINEVLDELEQLKKLLIDHKAIEEKVPGGISEIEIKKRK